VKAIDFSLALITKNQDASLAYLIPQKMVFQLYHPAEQNPDAWRQVGCLSVYIKTSQTGEGQGVGLDIPQFSGNKGNIYPIASGYAASIILSSWYYQWYETYIDVDIRHGITYLARDGFHLEGEWIPDYQDRKSFSNDYLIVGLLPYIE
jgi:hypothetical protein